MLRPEKASYFKLNESETFPSSLTFTIYPTYKKC